MKKQISINIQVLQAGYGDCLFITLSNSKGEYNILIDGGLGTTYYDVRDRRNPKGPLMNLLENLNSNGRVIDLLMLTHVDDDHVLGLKTWFEEEFPTKNFVKCLWINDDIQICASTDLNNSVGSTCSLIQLLRNNGFVYCNQIVKGMSFENEFCVIRVLAPSGVFHDIIATDMSEILNNAATDGYNIPLREYVKRSWKEGKLTNENKASIAIEIETKSGERVLMLGDAEIKDVINGIEFFHKEETKPIEYSWIKLPHHGSRNNFNPNFLDLVSTENFIVSTNGTKFHHPDKDVIAYIVDRTSSNIYFNYQDRAKDLFIEQDYIDYPQLKNRIKLFNDDNRENSRNT